MKKAVLLVFAVLVLAAGAGFAAQRNVTELKIRDMPVFVVPESVLQFSFIAGNRVGPGCNAETSYWIESQGKKFSEGKDSFYLDEGQVLEQKAEILVPSRLSGVSRFFIEMQCNGEKVLAKKTIESKKPLPVMPLISNLSVSPGEGNEQLVFSYLVEANHAEQVAIQVEEQVMQDGKIFWENTQSLVVLGNRRIETFGPVLKEGTYSLRIKAARGIQSAALTREFAVKALGQPAPQLPFAPFAGMAAVISLIAFAGMFFFWQRSRHYRPEAGPEQAAVQPLAGEEFLEPRQSICLVEADQAGTLGHEALEALMSEAGFSEEKKERAFRVSSEAPVVQSLKSCVFTARHEKMSFETIVTITVPNNSNKGWENVEVLAAVPEFLEGQLEEVSSDAKMEAEEEGRVFRFCIESIGAMQSASIVYRAKKLVSQDEATRLRLPAVTDYSEGKRAGLAKVRVRQKQANLPKKAVLGKKPAEENGSR